MPTKTIYVREEDLELWTRAAALAGDSLSALITRALSTYVKQKEDHIRGVQRIEFGLLDSEEHLTRKAFHGCWLISPDEEFELDESSFMAGWCLAAAVSEKGNIVMFTFKRGEDMSEYNVYDSVAAMEDGNVSADFVSRVEAELGEEYVHELDI